MLAASESSLIIPSFSRALVVSATTGLFIDLTIVPISLADSKITDARYTNKTTKLPVSDEERQRYLDELQSATTKTMIPAIVLLVFLAVTGLIGNSLVIYVYSRRLQWSATRTLIIAIAMCDLLANVVAIPAEIYDMLNVWDFNNLPLCKASNFVTAFPTLSSAIILVAVAVTRYRKVCHPHKWQITQNKAKVIGIVGPFLGALFSIPHVILMGRQTKPTPRRDIIAYECATDDEYVGTHWEPLNYMLFLLLFITASSSVTALYALIGMKVWKHSRVHFAAGRMATMTSSRYYSKATGPSYNENQSNSTRLGTYNNKSITGEPASCVMDIKMNQFHVSDKGINVLLKYGIPIFTDRIEIQTPGVGEFFVELEQTNPGVADIASHENSTYVTQTGSTVQQGNDAAVDARVWSIRVMEASISDGERREVQSSLGNVASNEKCTEMCIDTFLNTGNKSETARINNEINTNVSTAFNSKECSEKTILVHQYHKNVLYLSNDVDCNAHYQLSIQPAGNEALDESDPLSMFKCLDSVYCSEDEHTTCDSNCDEGEARPSFRLTPTNCQVQQKAWLRNTGIETMAREDETAAGSSFERVPVNSAPIDRFNRPEAYRDTPKREIDPSVKNLLRSRLREMLDFHNSPAQNNVPQQHVSKRRSTARITIMLMFISVIYVVGFVPHLGLMIFKFLSPNAIAKMSMAGSAVFNLFVRSYFLNSAANAIVYSLCDDNFRRDCFKFLKCR
ncbi:hypothetical protein BsWGS_14054 [Bradybaena similaris]